MQCGTSLFSRGSGDKRGCLLGKKITDNTESREDWGTIKRLPKPLHLVRVGVVGSLVGDGIGQRGVVMIDSCPPSLT